uniref:FunU11 n=1 Tax=Streptosporangium sp. KD35 TaxID=2162663 RepID=A0A2U9KCV6_9ACTN|nr:FunU11 [Streptosporangium sp. KD35]
MEGGGPARRERRIDLLGDVTGPGVVDVVVVEDHGPRCDRVGHLQVEVGLVLGVPQPVTGQVEALPAGLVAHRVLVVAVLVDVVAEEGDQIGVVLRHAAVGREPALLVVGAGGERQVQVALPGPGRGSGERTARGRQLVLHLEPVEVLGAGVQAVQLDVDAVRLLGPRALDPPPYDLLEPLVLGDLPVDRHLPVGHAAETVGGDGVHGEAGPQDDSPRVRFTGGHAQLEHVGQRGGAAARGSDSRAHGRVERDGEAQAGAAGHEGTSGDSPGGGGHAERSPYREINRVRARRSGQAWPERDTARVSLSCGCGLLLVGGLWDSRSAGGRRGRVTRATRCPLDGLAGGPGRRLALDRG